MEPHRIVSREEWLAERTALLAKEKAFTKMRDELNAQCRAGEDFLGIYRFFDITPKGRAEDGPYHSLVDWARPRNMYRKGGVVEGNGRFHNSACGCSSHK